MRIIATLCLVPAVLFHLVLLADRLGTSMPLGALRLALWLDACHFGDAVLFAPPLLAAALSVGRRSRALAITSAAVVTVLAAEAVLWRSAFGIADAAYRRARVERQRAADAAPSDTAVRDPQFMHAIAPARRWARGFMADFNTPGLQVAVSVGGRVVWEEAFGVASRETRRPLRASMPMRIHSVSKPITATIAARLAEAGRIELDAPVSRYVPSYRHGASMTPRQLATHAAGVRHYHSDHEVLNRRRFATSTERVAQFASDPLLFRPGTQFRYSSYGYVLLGAVIEAAAGTDYPTLLEHLVARPARAPSIRPDRGAGMSYYERRADGRLDLAPPFDVSNRLEAGGLAATAGDLVRFASAFLRGDLVSAATRRMMFERSAMDPKYGFGWELSPDGFAFHQGGSTGGMSILIVDPRANASLAVISNSNGELPRGAFPLPPHVVLRKFAALTD